MTYVAKQVSVSIKQPVSEVYDYASRPENLPKWAAGLSTSTITKSGDYWIAQSPMGKVKIKFAEKNELGVLDHEVTLPDGEVNYNPFRVVRNGNGSEVTFTLFRLPRMSDEDFEKDASMVEKDLEKLKSILEKR